MKIRSQRDGTLRQFGGSLPRQRDRPFLKLIICIIIATQMQQQILNNVMV